MEPGTYVEAIRNGSPALLDAARANLDAPVPSCPGWNVADLVAHTGGVWGWAANIVRTGARSEFPVPPEGVGGTDLLAWAEARSRELIGTLETADPASDCWTFGLPRSRFFWFRRQALETAVHAWDGQHAAGRAAPIDPVLASDGIDEFLAVMLARQLGAHPEGWSGQSVHFHCTDDGGEWTVRLGPAGAVTVERAHAKADVAVRGPASSVYLWCLNRVAAPEVEVIGDSSLAERWTSEIAF
jgi:uncharacterized protein (TIGR03083 family)